MIIADLRKISTRNVVTIISTGTQAIDLSELSVASFFVIVG